jgi:hypothetical protein
MPGRAQSLGTFAGWVKFSCRVPSEVVVTIELIVGDANASQAQWQGLTGAAVAAAGPDPASLLEAKVTSSPGPVGSNPVRIAGLVVVTVDVVVGLVVAV